MSIMLDDLGYTETNWRKPGLYINRLQHCAAYLDHRDAGGAAVGDLIPVFSSYPLDGHPAWLCNREAMREQSRLAEAGLPYSVQGAPERPLVGEPGYQTGHCKTCGKDFQAEGIFCGNACRCVFIANWKARNKGAPVIEMLRALEHLA